ncbi:MAG: RNA polymerase sigma-70 factor [Bacteroidota bacterium]
MDTVREKARDEHSIYIAFKTGDQQAFSFIFEKYYPALCFFTTRLTNGDVYAEDIVQDVFHKLWNKHNDFDNGEAIKAFLYISCRNASLNYLQKEKNKGGHEQELLRIGDHSEDFVLNQIIYSESLREINTAIDGLPEQCALVMRMLFQDGLKPQEVADQLNITVSTVYNQKARGIAALRERLSLRDFTVLLMVIADQFIN